jgi:hypothetical protein
MNRKEIPRKPSQYRYSGAGLDQELKMPHLKALSITQTLPILPRQGNAKSYRSEATFIATHRSENVIALWYPDI